MEALTGKKMQAYFLHLGKFLYTPNKKYFMPFKMRYCKSDQSTLSCHILVDLVKVNQNNLKSISMI